MQPTKDEYQYLEFKNGKVGDLLTLEQVSERIRGLEPVKPDYIAMQKRVMVGSKGNRPLYTATWGGKSYLIDKVSDSPDAFFVRGFNFDYTPSLGAKPTGPNTEWGGLAEPAGTIKPEGYRIRYPKGAKTPADRYYEMSDQPDEVFVAPVIDPPKGNQNVKPSYILGELHEGTKNGAV